MEEVELVALAIEAALLQDDVEQKEMALSETREVARKMWRELPRK